MGGMFKTDVVVGNSLFASLVEEVVGNSHFKALVEEAMQLWTKIWGDEALYEKAIAVNVQVLLRVQNIYSKLARDHASNHAWGYAVLFTSFFPSKFCLVQDHSCVLGISIP